MKRYILFEVLIALIGSACQDEVLQHLTTAQVTTLDEAGNFRIDLRNSSTKDLFIEQVAASCSCVTFREIPARIRAGSTDQIVGNVDRSAAPDKLSVSFVGDKVRHQVQVLVSGAKPRWDRGIIYRTGVARNAELGEVAGVYLNGTRSEVQSRLTQLEFKGDGIAHCSWSDIRPVEDMDNRWYAGLHLQLSPDAGPEPVTGVVTLQGAHIRVALIFRDLKD